MDPISALILIGSSAVVAGSMQDAAHQAQQVQHVSALGMDRRFVDVLPDVLQERELASSLWDLMGLYEDYPKFMDQWNSPFWGPNSLEWELHDEDTPQILEAMKASFLGIAAPVRVRADCHMFPLSASMTVEIGYGRASFDVEIEQGSLLMFVVNKCDISIDDPRISLFVKMLAPFGTLERDGTFWMVREHYELRSNSFWEIMRQIHDRYEVQLADKREDFNRVLRRWLEMCEIEED